MSFKTKAENLAYYKGFCKGIIEGKKQVQQSKQFLRQAEEPEWMKKRKSGIKDFDDRPVDPNININNFFKKRG